MKDQPKQDEELNEEDIFRHGTADPEIPSSKIPCSGCGAHLHCQDSKMPGFLPWEIFQKIRNSKRRLRKSQCQRCILINDYRAIERNFKPWVPLSFFMLLPQIKNKNIHNFLHFITTQEYVPNICILLYLIPSINS